MKKFLIIVAVLVIAVITITICFKSCQNKKDQLFDLLPESQKIEVTSEGPVIVKEIQQLGRLETISIFLQTTIQAERGQETLGGIFGEKMTFISYGEIIAGIDLTLLKEEDIKIIDPESLEINLPSAKIFNVVIDNGQSLVVSRQKGLLASVDSQLEKQVRQRAEQELEKQALALDVLNLAQQNAEIALSDFLHKLGFENIEFVADKYLDLTPKR